MNQTAPPAGQRTAIGLDRLLLDAANPRFGGLEGKSVSQADILDHIVRTFGVDDVLSSLAVNGYFDAEPIVCRQEADGNYVVVEGNRRLSACLILTDDTRAAHQIAKSRQFQKIWEEHGRPAINPVPCIVFAHTEQNALLSYLGVRHISPAQAWDSYAKAAWVAQVVDGSDLSLDDVALMIGDQYKTIARLLEGYYFIRQLIAERAFTPENSQRKGRGSISEYPFSWVYTILGYGAVRRYLGLGENERTANPPLKGDAVAKGALVVASMFGDRSKGKDAAIEDSREIGALAAAFASPEKISMLESGKSLKEIERQTQPLEERLRRGLQDVRDLQGDIAAALTQGLTQEIAIANTPAAKLNRTAAASIERLLVTAAIGLDDDGANGG